MDGAEPPRRISLITAPSRTAASEILVRNFSSSKSLRNTSVTMASWYGSGPPTASYRSVLKWPTKRPAWKTSAHAIGSRSSSATERYFCSSCDNDEYSLPGERTDILSESWGIAPRIADITTRYNCESKNMSVRSERQVSNTTATRRESPDDSAFLFDRSMSLR